MNSHSYVDDTKLQISFKLQNKDIAVAEMNEDLRSVQLVFQKLFAAKSQ